MAVRFSAENQAYTAGTAAGIPAGGVFTITCWIRIAVDRNAYSGPWAVHAADGTNRTQLSTDTDGTTLRLYDNSVYGSGLGGFALTAGTWYRVGVSMNGSNVSFSAGAEGQPLTTVTASDFTPSAAPTGLMVGRIQNTGAFFNGRIAAFKLWGAALTLAEYEAELGQYNPARTTNLIRSHRFITAPGTTNEAGSGGNLTAGAAATATEDGPAALETATVVPNGWMQFFS